MRNFSRYGTLTFDPCLVIYTGVMGGGLQRMDPIARTIEYYTNGEWHQDQHLLDSKMFDEYAQSVLANLDSIKPKKETKL